MITASQLRPGMAVRIEGHVYKVLETESKLGGGQMGGVVKSKFRDVVSGRLWEPHFRPDERLEDLELERQTLEFLFSTDEFCTFMNPRTFEQVEVPKSIVGPGEAALQPGTAAPIEFFEGTPISVVLPDTLEARVTDTAPPIHSGQDNVWKEAVLDNGLHIQVPLFIGTGEVVRIDVRSERYLERVRLEKKRGA